MDTPWKVIAAFLGVFIAGAVFGGVFVLRTSLGRSVPAPQVEQSLTQLPPSSRPHVAGPEVSVQAATTAKPPGPNPLTPALMRQFTQRLNLTAEQKEKVRPLVSQATEDFQRLRQENLADNARVTERMYTNVAAQLTPAQRMKLEAMREEMHVRVQAERKRRADLAAAEAAARAASNPDGPAAKRAVQLP